MTNNPEVRVPRDEPMLLAVALDFADNPRPYHALCAPADTNSELYEALRVLAAAYRAAAPSPSAPLPQSSYERMFIAACESLGEISYALGIPDEIAAVADGNAEILEAIARLKASPSAPVAGESEAQRIRRIVGDPRDSVIAHADPTLLMQNAAPPPAPAANLLKVPQELEATAPAGEGLTEGEREALDRVSGLLKYGGCGFLNDSVATLCTAIHRLAQPKAQPVAPAVCTQHRPGAPCPWPESCRSNGCSAVERELFADADPAGPEGVDEATRTKLLYGFMLDCNVIGAAEAGKNLARGIKESIATLTGEAPHG